MGVCNKKSNDLPFFGIMSSTKIPKYQKGFHCSWTLYSIYFNSFNTNINKFAGLLTLSVDISLLSSGLSMIPILQSTRSLRLMNFPKSYPISRTGTGKTLSLTTSNATTRPFALYFVELSAIYPNTALALPVMCLWTI